MVVGSTLNTAVSHPHLLSSPFLSCFLLVETQIRGHIAGYSLLSRLLRFVPCIFDARRPELFFFPRPLASNCAYPRQALSAVRTAATLRALHFLSREDFSPFFPRPLASNCAYTTPSALSSSYGCAGTLSNKTPKRLTRYGTSTRIYRTVLVDTSMPYAWVPKWIETTRARHQ